MDEERVEMDGDRKMKCEVRDGLGWAKVVWRCVQACAFHAFPLPSTEPIGSMVRDVKWVVVVGRYCVSSWRLPSSSTGPNGLMAFWTDGARLLVS